MAWTWPTATFFVAVAIGLIGMTLWEFLSPSTERIGILGIATTRGDRFFVSLLGSLLIELGWIGMIGDSYIASAIVCVLYSLAVFRWY